MERFSDMMKKKNSNRTVAITAVIVIAVLIAAVIVTIVLISRNSPEAPGTDEPEPRNPVVVPYENPGGQGTTDAPPTPTPDPGKSISGKDVLARLADMEEGKAYLVTDPGYIDKLLTGDEFKYARYIITSDGILITTNGSPIAIQNYGRVSEGSCITVTQDGSFILEGSMVEEDVIVKAYMELPDGSLSTEQTDYVVKKKNNEWDGNGKTLNINPSETYREFALAGYDGSDLGYVFLPESAYDSIKAKLEGTPDPQLPNEEVYKDAISDAYPDDDYEDAADAPSGYNGLYGPAPSGDM